MSTYVTLYCLKKGLFLYFTECKENCTYICIQKDLALNNLKWLIYHKIKPNQTKI